MRQLRMVAILVLCVSAASWGTISVLGETNPRTLVYSDPADLSTVIDPPGLGEVGPSLGVGLDKAAFQALHPQVVAFNGAPATRVHLHQVVANYSATGTVTFTFPDPQKFTFDYADGQTGYNYGGFTSGGKTAFSGTVASDDISTAPSATDDGALFNYFDAKITTTGGKGVGAVGLCVYPRPGVTVPASPLTVTLSDDSTATLDLPATGSSTFFVGYQAPAGKTITRIEVSHAPITGGGQAYPAIDDLAFVMVDDGSVPPLIGDINNDGYVNVGDLQALVAAWGSQQTPPSSNWNADADINDDGFVNVGDLQLLVLHWGESRTDTTAPAAVTDLAVGSPTISSLTLTWTAPGDDANTGTAASYDIRYSASPVTEANWASATQVTGEPAPAVAGTIQSMVVSGVNPSTTYYFALKTADEVPNTSAISNSPGVTTPPLPDTTAPAAVTNLAAGSPTSDSITLTWTAPGDDASTGTAASYDIRYATSEINDSNWVTATQVTGEPAPQTAGSSESLVLSGLEAGTTYYFALKTADEVPNTSALSNSPSGTTSAAGGLPTPWQHMDIGTSGGTASYAAPTFTIESNGWDINSTGDGFGYVYRPLSGDGTIIARVVSVENTHWAAKGGVMIREALTTGSKHAAITVTPSGTTAFQWRAVTDDATSEAAFFIGPPRFVKLVRSGNNFSAYESGDGNTWNQLGSTQTISMVSNVYVGMCVSAHVFDSTLCTGTFDNVSVTGGSGTDTTAPAVVTSLATSSPTSNSITLTWTAPGDDGSTGTAGTYDIRYSTSAINDGNWASATQVTGEPAPAAAGTSQNMVVNGLNAGTTYYFGLKTADEVPNWSALSNPCPSGTTTADTDGTAPAAVTNLAAGSPTSNSIRLTWTAPGDDGSTGAASTYDIRYSTSAINDGNWTSATPVTGEPTPAAAGTNQNMTVSGLSASTTYYFALKTADEVPNWSALSDPCPSGTTTSMPAGVLSPDDLTYVGCVMYPYDISGTDGFSFSNGTITGRRVGDEIRLFLQMKWSTFMGGYADGAQIVEVRYDGAAPTVDAMRAQDKRLAIVRNWGNVYDDKRLSLGGVTHWNGIRTFINWHPTAQRLYYSWCDVYNVSGYPDPHFGFSTLNDSTGGHSSYGPFRCEQPLKLVQGLQTIAPADWANTYTGGRRVLLGGMFTGGVAGCPFGANGFIINEPDTTTTPQTLYDAPTTGFTTYKRLVQFTDANPMPVARSAKACGWASPGNHAHLTAPFSPGQTTISIDDTTFFYNTTSRGSYAPEGSEGTCYGHIGPNDLAADFFYYTGKSTSSGPGTLTGVTYSGSTTFPIGTQITLGNYDNGRGGTLTENITAWGPLGAIYQDFMNSVAWIQTPTKQGVVYFGSLVDKYPGATYEPAGEDCPHVWYGFDYCPHGQVDPGRAGAPGPSAGAYRQPFAWIFDPEDFGKVVNNQMNWQDVRAVHQFALNQPPANRFPQIPSTTGPEGNIWGAWFDETSQLLFIAVNYQDSWTYPGLWRPMIHVFHIN